MKRGSPGEARVSIVRPSRPAPTSSSPSSSPEAAAAPPPRRIGRRIPRHSSSSSASSHRRSRACRRRPAVLLPLLLATAALASVAVVRRAESLSTTSPSPPSGGGGGDVPPSSMSRRPPPPSSPSSEGGERIYRHRPLPSGRLVVGYSHDPGGEKVRRAIGSGVNVVCWSFLHLVVDDEVYPPRRGAGEEEDEEEEEGRDDAADSTAEEEEEEERGRRRRRQRRPTVRTDLDLDAVRAVRSTEGWEDVVHVGAIGGWNAPHPPGGVTAEDWADAIWTFNVRNGYVFDGIDWDLEGHDDRTGATSSFTLETLDVMADVSVLLKRRHGMHVSLAPAESYFDPLAEDATFSLRLNLFPRPWDVDDEDRRTVVDAGFEHAGRQCYAYVWHRAGGEDTFDWVGVQLYEAYSRYLHETTRKKRSAADDGGDGDGGEDEAERSAQVEGVVRRTVAYFDGFDVDLPIYGRTRISVLPKRLVFGFANGWADNQKFVRVRPDALRDILVRLKIGGFMFWTVEEEGNGGVYMAERISKAIEESVHWGEHEPHDDDDDDDDDDDELDDDDDWARDNVRDEGGRVDRGRDEL